MFNKNNFCHVASNNRNEQKAGVFVYKTTDDLQTVLQYGYFNEKIIDINLHDLIIHVKRDATDRTKVERNLLCVVERTLDDVGTILIKSNWEKTIEETVENIQTIINSLDNTYVRIDGTSIITGPLKMRSSVSFKCAIAPSWDGVGFYKLNDNDSLTLMASMEATDGLTPAQNNTYNIGTASRKWKDAYVARVITAVINNGYDIGVPATASPDTLALKSEVDLAANSGRMITDQGVWYAKMYAATVAPSAENGTNYADFSQTDGEGNPIIVIYERQSGAWVQTETITPPAEYDGYVPITSKIWDIAEQTGQQGGRVLWNHQSKDFTPYPQIISFEDAALTGTPTAPLPTNASPNNQVATKEYVDGHSSSGLNVGDIFTTKRTDSSLAGAVECNGSTYNTTDFTGSGSVGELLEAGKLDYISLSAYSTAISTNGWCDKIGWDGTGTTSFRVPTLTPRIVQTNNIPVIGNGMTVGWTDGTNNYGTTNPDSDTAYKGRLSVSTSAYGQNVSNTSYTRTQANGTFGVTTDPTKSGIIADTSNTAQLRVMIQLANSATDTALETCTQVLSDVAELKYDYVVEFQAPTAGNNYTWYRKYKSGWVEQGGTQTGTGSYAKVTVNLPVTMADANYHASGAIAWANESTWYTSSGATGGMRAITDVSGAITDKTTVSFSIQGFSAHTWYVCGMAQA